MASPGLVAYVVDGDGGLRIIDVTDPAHPNELGFHNTPGHTLSTVAAGSLLYVVGGFSGLRILNVADPEQPLEIGQLPCVGRLRGRGGGGRHRVHGHELGRPDHPECP